MKFIQTVSILMFSNYVYASEQCITPIPLIEHVHSDCIADITPEGFRPLKKRVMRTFHRDFISIDAPTAISEEKFERLLNLSTKVTDERIKIVQDLILNIREIQIHDIYDTSYKLDALIEKISNICQSMQESMISMTSELDKIKHGVDRNHLNTIQPRCLFDTEFSLIDLEA